MDNLENDGTSGKPLESGESANMPMRSAPRALDEVVFSRLHSDLGGGAEDTEDDAALRALRKVGELLRQWRIRKNLTRRTVVEQLAMDVSQLLVLEHGLALQGDVTDSQLQVLLQWLNEDEAGQELLAAIRNYQEVCGK